MENNELEETATPQQRMRTVLLAAPSYDGTVNVWHANALAETCKLGLVKGINVLPLYMSYDALIQRARNDIFKMAYDAKVDDLVFIDCDVDWNPADFFKLLSHDVEVVGAVIPKKSDIEQYAVKVLPEGLVLNEASLSLHNCLVEVAAVGTGFLRIRKDAIEKIWDYSDEYTEPHKSEPIKMAFNVGILDGQLCSEDIFFCEAWRHHGGKVFIDPSINVGHTGVKRWIGDFYNWTKRVL
jgi:hypothetical protein